MYEKKEEEFRILVVDDNPAIHHDFQVVLSKSETNSDLDEKAALLFEDSETVSSNQETAHPQYELSFAFQGQEALDLVKEALQEKRPYALAFVDMRMPPGWDGLMTIEHLWEADPNIQVVICTAYSDYSWTDVINRLGHIDNLLILKKPFDSVEVAQMAAALTKKWEATRYAKMKMQDLERIVVERTRELETAIRSAEAASRAKSDFVATMSHEIRTPMNGIIGAISMISESQWSEEDRFYLEMIQASGETLTAIVNDILDFSKIEAGKLQLEASEMDLHQLIKNLINAMSLHTKDSKVELKYSIEPHVPRMIYGDAIRIRQVLTNLIGNAIKFTPSGEVFLKASIEDQGDIASISITDTGIGIPKEHLKAIFSEFYQSNSTMTRDYGGSGLGLAISNRLAQLMGGELTVESEKNTGSKFTLNLPLTRAPEKEKGPYQNHLKSDQEEGANFGGTRILVVEDNVINQKITKRILNSMGCDVDIAEHGAVALEMMKTSAYDLIIMDCQMPVMDGVEATKKIRDQEKPGEHITIIAVTANALSEDCERCLEAGMDDYLTKPVSKKMLSDTLKQWLFPQVVCS